MKLLTKLFVKEINKKNEEIKICKKLEDFIGLENGLGLILEKSEFLSETIKVFDKCTYKSITISLENNEILKSMGFKFEWKPKRKLQEIVKDYDSKAHSFMNKNYFICENEANVFVVNWTYCNFNGITYYSEEDCMKICKELNE